MDQPDGAVHVLAPLPLDVIKTSMVLGAVVTSGSAVYPPVATAVADAMGSAAEVPVYAAMIPDAYVPPANEKV